MPPSLPPPPGRLAVPDNIDNADTASDHFRNLYRTALIQAGRVDLAETLSAKITKESYARFVQLLKSHGMAAADVDDILQFLSVLAKGTLKTASGGSPLADISKVTSTHIRSYASGYIGKVKAKKDEIAAEKAAKSIQPNRPSSQSSYLKPDEEAQLRGQQSDYDFAFDTAGAIYAPALVRAMKLLQMFPDGTKLRDIRPNLVAAWYRSPDRAGVWWAAWLSLFNFNYAALYNWFPNIPPPRVIDDAAQLDAVKALCSALANTPGWKPTTNNRCQKMLTVFCDVLTTPGPALKEIRQGYGDAAGDMVFCERSAKNMLMDIAAYVQPTPSGCLFQYFRSAGLSMTTDILTDAENASDNMSVYMPMIRRHENLELFNKIIGRRSEVEQVLKRSEDAF